MGFLSSLFGSSNSSSSSTNAPTTTTNQADNRVVLGNGATQIGAGGQYLSDSGNSSSLAIWDGSQRNTTTSYSDARSTTSYADTGHNITNVAYSDPGAVQLGAMNAGLLQAVSENNGETVRALAKMGTDSLATSAAAATDLFATGSGNATQAWGQTIDAAGELIDRMMTNASATITGAQTVARDAISSYQPSDNKASDTQMRIALLGAAAVLAAALLTRR